MQSMGAHKSVTPFAQNEQKELHLYFQFTKVTALDAI